MKHQHWKERLTGNIDIWWIVGDGGALVLSTNQLQLQHNSYTDSYTTDTTAVTRCHYSTFLDFLKPKAEKAALTEL